MSKSPPNLVTLLSSLVYFLVRWHAGAVSTPQNAQLACPIMTSIFDYTGSNIHEAVFLVVCDTSMNEL